MAEGMRYYLRVSKAEKNHRIKNRTCNAQLLGALSGRYILFLECSVQFCCHLARHGQAMQSAGCGEQYALYVTVK